MSGYLSRLQEQADHFLSDVAILSEYPDRLVVLQAHYAVEAYNRSLFDTYDVDFPMRLINAVPKRLSEFLAGRMLAQAALEKLHRPRASIAIGEQGAPLWPRGISGSISHSHGKCACLVIAGSDMLVGLDVEKIAGGAALDAILKEALSPEERARVLQQTMLDAATLATLIFSAKETIFKTLHPVVRQFFGFEAARFNGVCDEKNLSFSIVQPLHPCIPENKEILIQFEIDDGFVRTWAILDSPVSEARV
ncbi:4'-phosphopantetheinyl transferase superfamily protein [Rhizobium sp. P38BS-XIX]|uniref:4'-phosphopantetheinyl transferase family protein n=1 Tax=Rhizobium sp. P38BS-XIX TaxID=2726740 RepID=UPI001FEEEF8A|nr:4'-phosphopantetheinyl transferase superfamily protein [Rhizobium sp. P38BS-XIX]